MLSRQLRWSHFSALLPLNQPCGTPSLFLQRRFRGAIRHSGQKKRARPECASLLSESLCRDEVLNSRLYLIPNCPYLFDR
jgi:hypothetical protein